MPDQIDLGDLVKSGHVSISPPETPEDREARLKIESSQHRWSTIKEVVSFSVFIIAVVVVGACCIYATFVGAPNSDEFRRWTQTTLITLITATASFMAGRKIGSK